jgi:hypothetical protein
MMRSPRWDYFVGLRLWTFFSLENYWNIVAQCERNVFIDTGEGGRF